MSVWFPKINSLHQWESGLKPHWQCASIDKCIDHKSQVISTYIDGKSHFDSLIKKKFQLGYVYLLSLVRRQGYIASQPMTGDSGHIGVCLVFLYNHRSFQPAELFNDAVGINSGKITCWGDDSAQSYWTWCPNRSDDGWARPWYYVNLVQCLAYLPMFVSVTPK